MIVFCVDCGEEHSRSPCHVKDINNWRCVKCRKKYIKTSGFQRNRNHDWTVQNKLRELASKNRSEIKNGKM